MNLIPRPILVRRRAPDEGMSLIELLIVLAIVGVICSIALPSMVSAVRGFRMHTAGHILTTRIGEARMEALRRNREVDVLLDFGNRTVTAVTLPGDVIIAGPEYMPTGVVFDAAATPLTRLRFDSLGRPMTAPPLTVTVRVPAAGLRRVVTVQSTGRLQLTQ